MQKIERPLSPHLQVYRPQWTSVLSITHRLTGVGLAVGTIWLVYWLAAAAVGPEAFAGAQDFAGNFLGIILLLGWTFCLFYHLCNGIRHLFWDAGVGFDLEQAYRSGLLVLIASVVLTVLFWIIGIVMLGSGS